MLMSLSSFVLNCFSQVDCAAIIMSYKILYVFVILNETSNVNAFVLNKLQLSVPLVLKYHVCIDTFNEQLFIYWLATQHLV